MAKKIFAWAPVRQLMKDAGGKMVSKEAVNALISILEEYAKEVTTKALEMTRHANRKKTVEGDIRLAVKLV